MTLQEYIKSLKEQGLTEEQMIPLVMEFRANGNKVSEQDTDENFQQDYGLKFGKYFLGFTRYSK